MKKIIIYFGAVILCLQFCGAETSGITFSKTGYLSAEAALPPGAGTIEILFKPNNCKNNEKLISFTKDKKNYAAIGFNPTTLIFMVKTAGKAAYGTIPKKCIEIGKWHHLAIIYEKSKFQLYLNGRKQSVAVSPGNFNLGELNPSTMRIGAGTDIREQFDGEVAGVRISAGTQHSGNFTMSQAGGDHSLMYWNFNEKWSDGILKSRNGKGPVLKVHGRIRCGTKIIGETGTKNADDRRKEFRPDPPRSVALIPDHIYLKLIERKKALAVIVVPDRNDHSPKYQRSFWVELHSLSLFDGSSLRTANLLADYIQCSTGVRLPVLFEKDAPVEKTQIHVGPTGYAESQNLLVNVKNDTGYAIKTVNPHRLVLIGGSNLGTEYAVYEFLERFLGIRWLFPGQTGTCVPASENLLLPEISLVSQPAFYSRIFRVKGPEGMLWCRRNRIHSRIEFHHNISKITSLKYAKTNPDIFPLINGKRRLPKRLNQDDWHLCYSNPASAGLFAGNIINFFKRYPHYESISLGVSDGNGDCYCHCEECQAGKGKKLNSFGFEDYSDLYYTWVNEVVTKVLKAYPDKKIGTLAYREVIDPPGRTVINPGVYPYLTWEALQWNSPARQTEFKKTFMKWCGKVRHPCLYDYVWTGTYSIPLLYPHVQQEYLQYILKHGAVGYYAENKATAGTVIGDGPALYILAKLLWNTDINVDKVMADWCESAVGGKAAPYLIKYYKLWEDYWTRRVKTTKWYGSKNVLYLMFNQMGYLENVTLPDIGLSDRLLKQVVATAGGGKQKERAELIYGFFADIHNALQYQVEAGSVGKTDLSGAKRQVLFSQNYNDGTQRWKLRRPLPQEPWDRETGRDAPGSIKIKSFKRGVGDNVSVGTLVMWQIKIQYGKKYLLEFYTKADKLPENADVSIILDWRDKDKNEKPFKAYKLVLRLDYADLGHGKWRKQQFYFTIPANKGKEACYFDAWLVSRNIAGGCYWIDDLSLIEID